MFIFFLDFNYIFLSFYLMYMGIMSACLSGYYVRLGDVEGQIPWK